MKIKNILQAARLRTLPLSVSGIFVGSALAFDHFKTSIFVMSIITTVLLQILSNFANDYGDGKKGVDNTYRIGPTRAVQSGKISLLEMKYLIVATAILCTISIITLVFIAFSVEQLPYILLFIALGGCSVVAAIKYTIGKNAYGYYGLGDIFVFLFFGWVSVLGSFFLYTHSLNKILILPASAIGLLCTSVLNLNNMRDIDNDSKMKKNTLVVKIGKKNAKYYHFCMIIVAMLLMLIYSFIENDFGFKTLYCISFLPLCIHLWVVKNIKSPQKLDPELKKVALSTFLLSVLFFVGKALSVH